MTRLLLVLLVGTLCSCVTGYSREYGPARDEERQAFEAASRTVFPDDVRASPEKYRDTTVAWTGIIEDMKLVRNEGFLEYTILCRHYYYDWIESFGPGTSRIWLSTTGEGEFAVYLRINEMSTGGFRKDVSKSRGRCRKVRW